MIIVEGCDKTGKTTLVDKLAFELGWEKKKFSQPGDDPFTEYGSFLEALSLPVVVDRFHIGEFVYPIVYRRPMVMTRNHFRTIELSLHTLGAVLVVTDGNLESVAKRFVQDREEVNQIHDAGLTLDLFKLFTTYISQYPFIEYDFEKRSLQSVVDDVISKWCFNTHQLPWRDRVNLFRRGYQGNPDQPEVLFVGEIVGTRGRGKPYHRVFGGGPSSEILFHAIHSTGLHDRDIGLVNCHLNEDDDGIGMEWVVDTVKPKKIVALGGDAYLHLVSKGIPCSKSTHPGFVLRFSTPQSDYDSEIRKVVE